MAKRSRNTPSKKAEKPSNRWYVWLAIPILVVVALATWWLFNSRIMAGSEVRYTGPIGSVTQCQVGPQFIHEANLSPQALLGTTVQGVTGLAIVDPDGPGGGIIQHETWDDAGYLGPYLYDKQGHIYTAAVPYVSLDDNPPEEQNKVYRVDTQSGAMRMYIDLPGAQPPNENNPFGVIGLAYDCETDSLYASSVAGSTPLEEFGRIFRIDLNTGEVANQFENVDSLGIGVFNSAGGKRLYYGRARQGVVYSIPLDEQGDFTGEPRREFSLADLGLTSTDKIRRITFPSDNEMVMKGVDFNYNPVVSSGSGQTLYRLRYLTDTDSWELIEVVAPEEALPGEE